MFVGKESNLSEWKQWAVGLVDNTLSSVDQAVSGWFWNLISDLPRDYFAKTFDQVNYLDRRVWEGIFRARIEGIKEQLESGISRKTLEADIIKLQGLIGKYSLSPIVYEDGLKELEDFVSDLNSPRKYLQLFANVRNEFREELRTQPLLLKECIKNDANLGLREIAYYQSLLDSPRSASSKETPVQPPALDKSVVNKRGITSSKLRNMSKLLFGSPAQAVTLFLAGQVAFANAVSIQLNNSSAVENSTLPFDDTFMSVSKAKENRTVSLDTFTENTVIENSKHFLGGNSTFEVKESVIVNTEKSSHSPFTKAFNDEIEKVKNKINKLIIALTQTRLDESTKVDVQRSKRSLSTNGSTTNNLSSSGTFTRPNPSSKVAKLENEMRKMKEDIEQLKQSSQIVSEDRNRLASLETTVETLKRLLDDQGRETEQKIANLESLVESLINVVNGFRKELDDMKKKAAEQEKIQKQKGLPAECVEAIKSHNFKAAEKKLQEINDDSKINLIIKEAYNYQISNFDLVLKFGDSVRCIRRSFLVYKALNYEMESNGHKDAFKMVKLIESLRKEIINLSNTPSKIKGEAESLASSLKDSVKAVAKEKLKDGMLNDRYASVKEIANEVYNFDSRLFGNAIKEAVDDIYGRMDTEKILSMIHSHSHYIEQLIQGYVAVFDKMKSNGYLNDRAIYKLAYYIKETMEMTNYANVNSDKKSDLENLKGMLPGSVRNVVFSKDMCIKNVLNNLYLLRGMSRDAYKNNDMFPVRAASDEASDNDKYKWNFEAQEEDNVFVIRNHDCPLLNFPCTDGYLSVERNPTGANNGWANPTGTNDRHAMVSIDNSRAAYSHKWQIEPNGNNIRIKNVKYNEYLYSTSRNDQSSDVYISGSASRAAEWRIESCNSSRRKRNTQENVGPASFIKEIEATNLAALEDVKPSSKIHDLTLENVSQNISSVAR